jgi:predicted membrane-bound mannosyltransferase
MALICSNCGADNPKSNRFCDTCGAKLNPAAVAEEAPAKAAKPVKAVAARKKDEEAQPEPALVRASSGGLGTLSLAWDSPALWMTLIVIFGAILRLWDLGAKPLHHDESIHAWYAFKLFKGEAYRYDPAYHGPFRYHFNALMFFIFGASDYTTRILPALIGIGGLIFLWSWRGLLGEKGAVFAAAMVAISPSWVYNSRFIRDDITMAVGFLLVVWGLFKHFETRAPKYLYWSAAGLMMSFCSHEGTWIMIGILGSFLAIRYAWEQAEGVDEEHADLSGMVKRLMPPLVAPQADMAGAVAALAVLVAGFASKAWVGLGFVGAVLGMLLSYGVVAIVVRLLFFGSPEAQKAWRGILLIFFVPFTLLYSTFFTNMDGWFMGAFDSIAYWLGEQKTGRADQPWQFYLYMLSLYELAICCFAAFGGLRLYFSSGKAQYFFLKILAFLPFIFAILILERFPKSPPMVLVMSVMAVFGGGLAAWSSFEAKRGSHFKVFLLYWSMLALIMFTIAGERMPWLTLHPLTPLTLLAALYLDDFFNREQANWFEHFVGWALIALPLALILVMGPRQLLQAAVHAPEEIVSWARGFASGGRHGSFQPSGWLVNAWQNQFLVWMFGAVSALIIGASWLLLQRWPALKSWTRGIFIGAGCLGLASLSHGTMNLLFHGDGADPREQHVYVQSSIELVELTAKLDRMSRALTGGPYLKVAVEDLCSWPMSWYLRDFKNAQIGFGPPLTANKVPDFPVVMTGYDNMAVANHDQQVSDSFSNSYTAYPVRFRRWWAPDKAAFFQGSLGDQVGRAWDLYMYREPWMPLSPIRNPQFENYVYAKGDSVAGPYGSFDACVWVRKDVEKYFQ